MPDVTTKPKNVWLLRLRSWHGWLGIVLSLPVLAMAATGICLNHRAALFGGRTDSTRPDAAAAERSAGRERGGATSADVDEIAGMKVSFATAIQKAANDLGDTDIRRVELRGDRGRWAYHVVSDDGRDAAVDADTGAVTVGRDTGGTRGTGGTGGTGGTSRGGGNGARGRTDQAPSFARFIHDLHTGRLFDGRTWILGDVTGAVLALLTVSGIYLWGIPRVRNWRGHRDRAAEANAATKPATAWG